MIIISCLLNIPEFIGRFHPLLVHLPIGILLMACLFYWLGRRNKYQHLRSATGIALFWGMISAVLSCISGWMLSRNGDYEAGLTNTHKWFGLSVAFVSAVVYLFHRWENGFEKWLIPLLGLLIIITGHLGGSLTHGADYLANVFSNKKETTGTGIKPIADVQEANVYAEIVQPIFQSKCYTCHNASRKKGGLRLDEPVYVVKGGKDGKIIEPGNAEASEMIKRLLLPRNDEDHMPPKEKPQLKENEIALLHWWVASGASFDKKTKELQQPDKIRPVLLALQKEVKTVLPDVPQEPVAPADEKAIAGLKERGVVIIPVARNSNYLSASFVSADSVSDKDLEKLLPVKKQLVWLKLSGKKISDDGMKIISQLTGLTRLQLDHTGITDKGFSDIQSLTSLQYLNLVGTAVSANGLEQLKSFPGLQAVYIYQTGISGNEWNKLKNYFPNTVLDTGRYIVPVLETDTTEVQPPKKNKN